MCLDGVGWAAPAGVSVYAGTGASLAVMTRADAGRHSLRRDRPAAARTLIQLPVEKVLRVYNK